MLSLHLLQLCLVYINTLMMQQVLSEEPWRGRLQAEDLWALTPLVYGHVTPYGTFRLDMSKRLVALDQRSIYTGDGFPFSRSPLDVVLAPSPST